MPAFLAWPVIRAFFGSRLKRLFAWFGTLNLWQITCITLGLSLAEQHVALLIEHRHTAKVELRLTAAMKLYHDEQLALAQTVANYRAAAEQARKDDAANKVRVEADQAQITREQSDEYEARIVAARAVADRLRSQLAAAAADPGGAAKPPVPGVPAPARQPAQTAQDRLSDALTATEQAIQLDELIKWVRRQHAVDPNASPPQRN